MDRLRRDDFSAGVQQLLTMDDSPVLHGHPVAIWAHVKHNGMVWFDQRRGLLVIQGGGLRHGVSLVLGRDLGMAASAHPGPHELRVV